MTRRWAPYGQNTADDREMLLTWLRTFKSRTFPQIREAFEAEGRRGYLRMRNDLRALESQGKIAKKVVDDGAAAWEVTYWAVSDG